jgi:hypothetical protein
VNARQIVPSVEVAVPPEHFGLERFEIRRYADGHVDHFLPHVVWVDRANPLPFNGIGIGCTCNGPLYPIRDSNGAKIICTFPGYTPSVCACMGDFVGGSAPEKLTAVGL